jgi:hypothetical protein
MPASRVPGTGGQKLELLATLDAERFPDLVCDVLHFSRGYRDVKVVGGPGDGRRDITGRTKGGDGFVCQCKFHENPDKAVSSRETDEIAIAMAKFGVKHGVFATTGRVSPQALREYEVNFPDYELLLLTGVDIVEAIFASVLLRQVWVEDHRLALRATRLTLPVIARATLTDEPRLLGRFLDPDALRDAGLTSTLWAFTETDFAPYREPSPIAARAEAIGVRIEATAISRDAAGSLLELSRQGHLMQRDLFSALRTEEDLVQLRIGSLQIADEDQDSRASLPIPDWSPITYVVRGGQAPVTEREWVLPETTDEWLFQDHFGALEADWAGWLHAHLDCVLIPHVSEPTVPRYHMAGQGIYKMKAFALERSLFVGLSDADAQVLLATLPPEHHPRWSSRGVATDRVLGWFHPAYDPGFSLRHDENLLLRLPEDGDLSDHERQSLASFRAACDAVTQAIATLGARRVAPDDAIALSRLGDSPILSDLSRLQHRSADLFYFFDEIPSPMRLDDRSLVYVQMWDIVAGHDEFDAWEAEGHLSALSAPLWYTAKRAPRSGKLMPMLSLRYEVPADTSTKEAVERQQPRLTADLAAVANVFRTRWPLARTATEEFWRDEVGLFFR